MLDFKQTIKPLEPNEDNIIKCFCKDYLNRRDYVFSLTEQLIVSNENYVIALDGKWGTGKTFILKQIEYILKFISGQDLNYSFSQEFKDLCTKYFKERDLEDKTNIIDVVYFNAWQNDIYKNPLISLLIEITDQLELIDKNEDPLKKAQSKLWEIISNFNLGINIGFINVEFNAINNLKKAKKSNTDESKTEESNYEEAFFKARSQKAFIENLDEFFRSLTYFGDEEAVERQLILIIDELDRCKPEFAIQLLEQIKFFLGKYNITVVFGINRIEFESIINSYYGNNFNSAEYLDRFFDIVLDTPYIKSSDYINFLLENKDTQPEDQTNFIEITKSIVNAKNLSLRDIERYLNSVLWYESFLINKWSFIKEYCNKQKLDEFYLVYFYFTPIIIYLRLFEPSKIRDFLRGNEPNLFLELLFERGLNELQHKAFLDRYLMNFCKDSKVNKNDKLKIGLKSAYTKICEQSNYYHSNVGKVSYLEPEADPLDTLINELKTLLAGVKI